MEEEGKQKQAKKTNKSPQPPFVKGGVSGIFAIITITILLILSKNIIAASLEEKLTYPQTQKQAIKELWDKKEAAIPELKQMLKTGNKELKEIALVRGINLKNSELKPEAKDILNNETDLKLRKRAMQYFCAIKDKSIIPILQNKIQNSKEEKEKIYAIETAAYIISGQDKTKEYEEIKNTLKKSLKDKSGLVRMEAAYELAKKLEDESGYNIAAEDIKNSDALIRERAVEAIGEIGREESKPIIEQALQDKEIWVRTKAKIAKEQIELVKIIMPEGKKSNQKMNKETKNKKIAKLREILNSDKILDVKIWAANELLDMDGGKEIAEEMIKNNEAGAYVVGKEMRNRIVK